VLDQALAHVHAHHLLRDGGRHACASDCFWELVCQNMNTNPCRARAETPTSQGFLSCLTRSNVGRLTDQRQAKAALV
jgi:hypothetical protein